MVVAAFMKPRTFQQLFFPPPLSAWRMADQNPGKSASEIVTTANQAVVTVIATRAVHANQAARPNDAPVPSENSIQRGTGTGFIIETEGYIVTNEHVVKDADRIRIKLSDGRERRATIQGTDPSTDLALLKIEAEDLRVLSLGDSDSLLVGDPVIAIGNPLEYEHTVTAGIVSAKGRKVYNDKPYEDYIQTDAAINRGNSGGPLLNRSGEVIGVNTVIRIDGRGISFAVPSNVVKRVVTQLRSHGFVARGFLGLTPANLTPEFREGLRLGEVQGVLVVDVSPGYPAFRAGIQPYDVITHFDGHELARTDDFFGYVANTLPQRQVVLDVIRDGARMKLTATLESRPDDRPMESRPVIQKTGLSLGFSVRENNPKTIREIHAGKSTIASTADGVIVSEVDPLGPAADSLLRSGQIILEANRQPIHKLEDFQRVISQLGDGSALVLRVTSPHRKDLRLIAIRIEEL
ncbi:MAG TPA: trypsin-like peptidase domain-containing protein [Blastocatellia bacterium]|nr:trypsin-like peptidase domain-containing protein [Blastocatellia bacterium]